MSGSPTENQRRKIRIRRRKINNKLNREAKIAKKEYNKGENNVTNKDVH